MSLIIEDFGSWGSGRDGDVTDPQNAVINAYAVVEEIKTYSLLVNPISNSAFVSWSDCVGCQVLLHGVAAKDSKISGIGWVAVATITAQADEEGLLRLSLSTDYALAPQSTENAAYWQAILLPEFKNLTLQSKSVKPKAFALSNTPIGGSSAITAPCGGVVAFKCSNTLTLAGGHVDLRNTGYPADISTVYRPNFNHETNGTLDTDTFSGAENSVTKDKLLLNVGDGACFIMAKTIDSSVGSSRIGNPNVDGVRYCRGASDSPNAPSGVSNLGGSSISIVCNSWTGFTPAVIAKYRSGTAGRGLARACITAGTPGNTFLPDEGLYALDCTQNKNRPKEQFNLSGFGNGQDGNYNLTANAHKCWNSYAKVTAVSGRVYTISRVRADVEEVTDFAVGRLVMIHQTRKTANYDYQDGNFKFSRIIAISGNLVTIKHDFTFNLSTYNLQMIVVPEYNNLTFAHVYKNTPKYSDGCGGIFAICVKGNCDLSDGIVNMEGKGNPDAARNPMLGNYWLKRGLPLGKGHGSILLIAKNLTLNSATRLGATYDGSTPSGYANYGTARSGESLGDAQGAHILIISDNITGLHVSAISTGGDGAGSGYRGNDGVSGAAFIYCNDATGQITTNLALT